MLTDPLFLAPRCYGHTAALAFLYLLCPLPVTKLGFYFSDRWHILSSFRGKSLWNYFIAFLVPNQRLGLVGGYNIHKIFSIKSATFDPPQLCLL